MFDIRCANCGNRELAHHDAETFAEYARSGLWPGRECCDDDTPPYDSDILSIDAVPHIHGYRFHLVACLGYSIPIKMRREVLRRAVEDVREWVVREVLDYIGSKYEPLAKQYQTEREKGIVDRFKPSGPTVAGGGGSVIVVCRNGASQVFSYGE